MKKTLRIAMLGQRNSLSEFGGIDVVAGELSRRMAALGHDVTLYNRKKAVLGGHTVTEQEGVHIRYVPGFPVTGAEAASSSLCALLRAMLGNSDVVHIHGEGPSVFCFLPRLRGKKVVVTIHGLDYKRAKWGRFASSYLLLGERNAVRYADEIIVLSKNVQRYFEETYGRRTDFIPNGIPKISGYTNTPTDGLTKDGFFLFLGRLVPEKGLMTLLDAYASVKTDRKLVIAGGSGEADSFVRRLKEKADPRVLFVGEVHGKEKAALFSCAHAYILPSEVEGMPLSLLEAIAGGLCCVTSDIPECAEILEGYGLTFPKGDVAALAQIIDCLDKDEAYVQHWREKVRHFPRENYNWDNITERTLELYRRNLK